VSQFEPGSKVVIRFNPHREHAAGIVGTVVAFHAGKGFMSCDLADVEYEDPWTGEVDVLPFSTANLSPGSPPALRKMAERYVAIGG
jgi:hypothetical protein